MRYPEIAKRFRIILNKRNMKARDLSNKANMTEAAISHYVHGNRCPGNKTATILADILGCNPLWLMDLDDNMYKSDINWTQTISASYDYHMDNPFETQKMDIGDFTLVTVNKEQSRIEKLFKIINEMPEPKKTYVLDIIEAIIKLDYKEGEQYGQI